MTEINSTQNNNDRWWIAAFVTVLLLWLLNAFWNPTRAQKLDTLTISASNIERIIEKKTPKTIRYYALYRDSQIEEIIPIGKSDIQYLEDCKTYDIKPALGIKLKDGKIVSIIRRDRTLKIKVR